MALLTSREEIERVFSVAGVENHLEDTEEPTDVLDEIIVRASETCLLRLRGRFSEAACEDNPWVRSKATYIACYLLSVRSGNPSLYATFYEEALLELEQVRLGQLSPGIPSNAPSVVQKPIINERSIRRQRISRIHSTRVLPQQNPYDFRLNEP